MRPERQIRLPEKLAYDEYVRLRISKPQQAGEYDVASEDEEVPGSRDRERWIVQKGTDKVEANGTHAYLCKRQFGSRPSACRSSTRFGQE